MTCRSLVLVDCQGSASQQLSVTNTTPAQQLMPCHCAQLDMVRNVDDQLR